MNTNADTHKHTQHVTAIWKHRMKEGTRQTPTDPSFSV